MRKILFTVLLLLSSTIMMQARQIAFPGAEGYGKYTVGGRGGRVIEVTNLNDDGPGSLRAAVDAAGPRTVVFRVSGTIILQSTLEIRNPYITIAGQTAPGDGICLRKYQLLINADQVIIRYIRSRLGNESGGADDAMGGRFHSNIIIDHVSTSWSVDETMSVYHCDSVTIQWCILSESLFNSNHPDDADPSVLAPHGFGGIWGSNNSSYHHNLIADHSSRNPRMASGTGYFDYRNNVIYNWGYNSCYGGEKQQVGDTAHAFTDINMVNNYYKPGPATQPGDKSYRIANPGYRDVKTDYGKWYIAGNYMVGNPTVTANNWKGGVQPAGGMADTSLVKLDQPWPAMAINQQSAHAAYVSVLDSAGCCFPKRDPVDARIVHDTRYGVCTYEGPTYKKLHSVADKSKICGIIDTQDNVGGWPVLKSEPAPADTDHDGMPDAWETAHGLNPNDASDRNAYTLDSSYTNLEVYLNSIIKIDTNIPVTGFKLSKDSIVIGQNETYQLTDTITPENAPDRTVLWTSTSPSVATVDISGVVTGVSNGTSLIIGTTLDGSFKDTCVVKVQFMPVTGVSITPSETNVCVGSSTMLKAIITPTYASNKNVTWSSSDSSVVTVSDSGVVKGVALGSAVITATTEDGSFTATSTVTVSTLPTPLVQLDFNNANGNNVANTGSLPATFTKTVGTPDWSSNVPVNGGASSLDYGTTDGAYYVESDSIINELAGMTDFTVTAWVNCRDISVGSGGNRIVTWINSGGDGVDIVHDANGSLKVGINEWPDKTTAISSTGEITADASAGASNWKFFAVTYSSETNTVNMYFGNNTTTVTLDKSFDYNKGAVGTNIGHLCIGQFNAESRHYGNSRMFKGLIDGVRIYKTVLSLDQVRAVQTDATTGLFQPTSNEAGVKVYPNPFTNELNVNVNGLEGQQVNVDVYNLMGRLVATSGNVVVSNNKVNLTNNRSLDELPAGGYIGVLKSDNQTIANFKLFKK